MEYFRGDHVRVTDSPRHEEVFGVSGSPWGPWIAGYRRHEGRGRTRPRGIQRDTGVCFQREAIYINKISISRLLAAPNAIWVSDPKELGHGIGKPQVITITQCRELII